MIRWFGIVAIGLTAVIPAETALWQPLKTGILDREMRCFLIQGGSPRVLGTERGLYSQGEAGVPRLLFQPSGRETGINAVIQYPEGTGVYYAATDNGIYRSQDGETDWKNIPGLDRSSLGRSLSVQVAGGRLFAGTEQGVYLWDPDVSVWEKLSGPLGHARIPKMGAAGAYLYAIAGNEVYRVDSNDLSTQKIYNETVMEEDADLLINGEETDTVFNSSALKDMVVLDGGRQYIFLAADSGVLFKNVDEERWHDLPRLGLVPETVTSLAVAVISSHGPENAPFVAEEPSFPWRGFRIFAGTNNGVYELAGNQWTATASGMSGGHVLSLAMAGDKLFAGTDRGVFALSPEESAILGSISDAQVATVKERFAKEPTVSEVQLLALEYADVSPQKIKRWQKAAQSSAWMPTLSTGLSRADTELFHWDSGGNPDSLLKGRDYLDWSLSLSWDFSEVIWNPAQTSIDSRAKLMSELREDILDQVTRIYFERRRMQMELLLDAAADARSHLEREMRIAELTALLDAHTGGGFSRLCAMN